MSYRWSKPALKPVIDTVVPMSDAAQAHTLLESGSPVGNVVLDKPEQVINPVTKSPAAAALRIQ
jgi:hypothetical protein